MGKTLTKNRCVIFGGMISEIPTNIIEMLSDDDFIICADRGYEFAKANNIRPDLIVGDFDSTNKPQGLSAEIITLPTKKDETDLHFAAVYGVQKGYKNFLISGVTGGRLDHTFASFSTLKFLSQDGRTCRLFDANTKAYYTEKSIELKKPEYPCYLSVFPARDTAIVSVKGAEYSADEIKLSSEFPLGVSNHFLEDTVLINVKNGACFILIVKD